MGVRHLILSGLAGLWALSTAAHAVEPVSIVVQEMPGLIEPDASLPYNRLLSLLLEESPLKTTTAIYPGYRGPRQWLRHEYQCIFGGISAPGHRRPLDTAISKTDWSALHISTPFNILKVHAFSKAGQPVATQTADLADKTLAVDQILSFDLRFHTDAFKVRDLLKVGTAAEALQLMDEGRVQYALAYNNDVALLKIQMGNMPYRYDPALTLLELEESMMCWSGPGVRELVSHINERLAKLQASGQLKVLLPSLAP